MSKAIICDKCDLILPLDGAYKMLVPMVPDGPFPVRDDGDFTYLCRDCYERFNEWVVEREAE